MSDAWLKAAREYQQVAQRLWQRGLIAGSGGNLSLRVGQTSHIMIKPSGLANIDCQADNLLGVDVRGQVVVGRGRPSKDLGFHLAIYRVRPDVRGIVHAHVPWSTALSLLDYDELPLLTPHAQSKLVQVPVVPFAPSGSQELDNSVAAALAERSSVAIVLARHGLVTVGSSLPAAGRLAELVEETAQIAWLVHAGRGSI